jgi:hypothetical protein
MLRPQRANDASTPCAIPHPRPRAIAATKTKYPFKIQALNAAGWGESSAQLTCTLNETLTGIEGSMEGKLCAYAYNLRP